MSGEPTLFDPPGAGPLILSDPAEVERQLLARLRISTNTIQTALTAGLDEMALVTDDSPNSMGGTRMWDGTLVSLRRQLRPNRWKKETPGNLEVVRRSDERVQLTASIGSKETGDPDRNPRCQHPRGASTRRAAQCNRQMCFADMSCDPAWADIETWWLLYDIVRIGGDRAVRSEVSLPTGMDGDYLSQWSIRLILPNMLFGSDPATLIPESAPEAPVGLQRRTA